MDYRTDAVETSRTWPQHMRSSGQSPTQKIAVYPTTTTSLGLHTSRRAGDRIGELGRRRGGHFVPQSTDDDQFGSWNRPSLFTAVGDGNERIGLTVHHHGWHFQPAKLFPPIS